MPPRRGRVENLKPFQPGNQASKGHGRRKKLPGLDKLLADVLSEEKEGVPAAKAILMKLRQMATTGKGDVRAAEVLLERAYGKVKQKTVLTGPDPGEPDAPIKFAGTSDIDITKLPTEVLEALLKAKRDEA